MSFRNPISSTHGEKWDSLTVYKKKKKILTYFKMFYFFISHIGNASAIDKARLMFAWCGILKRTSKLYLKCSN